MSGIDWELLGSNNNSLKCSNSKDEFIDELQRNTNEDVTEFVTAYDVKIGMPFFKQKAIVRNIDNEFEIECIVNTENGKDIIQNSITKVLQYGTKYNIKVGDYVIFKPNWNDGVDEKTYIVFSEPVAERGYFSTYMIECTHSFNILDYDGNIVNIPFYTDDNKIVIRDSSISVIRNDDISTTWITVPDNRYTRMLNCEIKRIIIKGFVFKIIGCSYVNSVANCFTVAIQTTAKTEMDDLETGIAHNENYSVEVKNDESIVEPIVATISGYNEVEIDSVEEFSINIDCDRWETSNDLIEIINSSPLKCSIYIPNKKTLRGKVIKLFAFIGENEFSKDITIV